jgi:hypothetical protein
MTGTHLGGNGTNVPHELGTTTPPGTTGLASAAGLAGADGPEGAANPARCGQPCPVPRPRAQSLPSPRAQLG